MGPLDVLNTPELFEHLASHMDALTLVRLASTSRRHYQLAKGHWKRRWYSLMLRWTRDPRTLHSKMRDIGMIITGNFVLRYLLGGENQYEFIPKELDLFGASDRTAEFVGYLQSTGYRIVTEKGQTPTQGEGWRIIGS